MHGCPECDQEFDTELGRNTHYGKMHGDVPATLKTEFDEDHRRKIAEAGSGENNPNFGGVSEEHRENMSKAKLGEKNPMYDGGLNGLEITPTEWNEIKEKVHDRDGNQCVDCGATQSLATHHIDRDQSNNKMSNLVTLCHSCHARAHSEQDSDWGVNTKYKEAN